MEFRTLQVEIDKAQPFRNDLFGREIFAKQLTNVVSHNNQLVLCLDGQWGEGKTTFIKMWEQSIKKDGFESIYIDAFANDYTDDAFVTIAAAINQFVQQKIDAGECKEQGEDFKRKSKEAFKKLFIWSGKLGLKALTLNLLDNENLGDLQNIAEDFASDSSEQLAKFAEQHLLEQQQTTEIFAQYKQSLATVAKTLQQQDGTQKGSSNRPLVVILDELDRCRPSFAVQVLEKIKHFFSVENVVFVLCVNREQLTRAIQAEYGSDIEESFAYLQKFIDLYAMLPRFKGQNIAEENVINYLNELLDKQGISSEEYFTVSKYLKEFAVKQVLSYRQCEKIVLHAKLLISSSHEHQLGFEMYQALIAFVAYISVVYTDIANQALTNKLDYPELLKLADNENLKDHIKFCYLSDEDRKADNENMFEQFQTCYRVLPTVNNPLLYLLSILFNFSYLKF